MPLIIKLISYQCPSLSLINNLDYQSHFRSVPILITNSLSVSVLISNYQLLNSDKRRYPHKCPAIISVVFYHSSYPDKLKTSYLSHYLG